ncbi:hypothetical protein G7Y89_g4314 [Cudoniella acicularis]|uniref:Heterokaryon incompatibility domain-containing protein n=1 Tax=Cudoniella acicularis TaxID=354080 RepID=A0A8H4RPQ6_9HELO|nr:hypothetical protein G7Y89_g4314 [Cudoniella acicularis]
MPLYKFFSQFSNYRRKHGETTVEKSTPYEYTPVDEAADEIRLLTLYPGAFTDPVRVAITVAPFTTDHVPVFEALSYTWGSPKNPVRIFVGQSGHNILSVTKNLSEALPYLRYEDEPRVLWIDAICINQQDLKERSQQVKRMADIYSKAARVVVWLGLASETTSMAIICFDTIASHIDVNWPKLEIRALSVDRSWADLETAPPFDRDACLAILEFLGHQWFERLWIYQEIRLAAEGAILMCGYQTIQWTSFRKAPYFLARKVRLLSLPDNLFTTLRNRIDNVMNLCRYSGYLPLERLIEQTKNCKCSDSRDRIFALLSLLDEEDRCCGIKSDYTKNVRDVYQNVTKGITAFRRDLSILGSAEMHEGIERGPSWVPDWSRPRRTERLPISLASSCSWAISDFSSEGILKVPGKVADTIELVEQFKLRDEQSTREIAAEIKRVVLRLMLTNSNVFDLDLHSICRTLCVNDFSERYDPPKIDTPSLSLTELRLADVLHKPEDAWQGLGAVLSGVFMNRCHGRSMYRTTRGHLGLAPEAAQRGDLVTILLGCRTPVILRPTGDGYFKVVGEAYCDGFENGEVLLGPLPNGFRFIKRWNEEAGGYCATFLNSETGAFGPEDPRLSHISLPLGWVAVSHEQEQLWTLFINYITGDDSRMTDPRLTPDALKQRGVDVQTFNLI